MNIVKIFELIDNKDPKALQYVQMVSDIDYQDKNGNTMLHRAAMSENHVVLDYLLSHHADINIQNKSIFTALVIAVYMEDSYAVKQLLDYGTDTELAESNGWSPLVIAVDKKSHDIVRLLVDAKANVDIISTKTGEPLILGCTGENKPLREIFIKAGANVLAGDSEGLCALHQIIDDSDVQMLEELKNKGFDFNVLLPEGYMPLYQTPLMYAAHSEDTPCIKKLLEFSADIHYQHPDSVNCFIGYLSEYKQDEIFHAVISEAKREDFFKLKSQLKSYVDYYKREENNVKYINSKSYIDLMDKVEMHYQLGNELKDKDSFIKKAKI